MDKKEIIQEAAAFLFSSKGYHATTIRDIAKYANVNVAMITYYFTSKENLLLEIIHNLSVAVEMIDKDMEKSCNYPEKKLYDFIHNTLDISKKLRNVCKLVLQLQMLDAGRDINKTIRKIKEKHYTTFLAVIQGTDPEEKWFGRNIYLYNSFMVLLWEDLTSETFDTKDNHLADISVLLYNYLNTML
ncbi:transcriptional regulator, TetR family [Flavobacterium aquidurense]|uniref:HTH tetR-type domain-containing protein n=1 Tax=Flavobacterium frigidimaris TaxID=262320 RepID=A0ABX4BN22_FLAFR|nr:TetR/AcrR family transcriptional regulator [Flavobacterium frigidimaris]OXA77414.1 hypothetical protein B0A65_16330 [Flavobacterium frigidimaris]SDZ62588.1 transcriptional regulator, TetR family [Flavobacterium aquidurense]